MVQGFKDSSISIFEASCILHKYEERTGLTVTREELDSGALKTKLAPSDYDTTYLVGFLTHSHLCNQTQRRYRAPETFCKIFPAFRVLLTDFP